MRVGIDIGTDVARVAMLDATGTPKIMRFANGTATLPNVVRQTMHGLSVGQAAAETIIGNSETTVLGCTRLLGNADHLPSQLIERSPYPVRVQQTEAMCDLLYAEQPASVMFGAVLNHIVQQVQIVGETVESIVLTVPASADHRFRVQARQAAEQYGIHVTRLVNQPTAAVLAAHLPDDVRTVLVVNCSASVSEISLAERSDGVRIVATVNQQTGGDSWTWQIAEQLAQRLAHNGISIEPSTMIARLGLHRAAGEALETLSLAHETMLALDHIGGFGRDALLTIQRRELETWLESAMRDLTKLTKRSLSQAKIAAQQIDAVLLIGEYSHVPQVQQAIFKVLPQQPRLIYAPDAPAKGAAMLTASDQPLVWDVTPYPLGISCFYGNAELFSPIIGANTPIPTPAVGAPNAKTETFWTRFPDQKSVTLDVLQYRGIKSAQPKTSDQVLPHECEALGTWQFAGLHPKKGQTVPFTVTFAIDTDGILHLFAKEDGHDHTLSAQVDLSKQ